MCVWVCVHSVTVMSDSLWPPWTVAHQSPLSIGFSRQEYWSGLPLPPPGTFLALGLNPRILHWQVDSLPRHRLVLAGLLKIPKLRPHPRPINSQGKSSLNLFQRAPGFPKCKTITEPLNWALCSVYYMHDSMVIV